MQILKYVFLAAVVIAFLVKLCFAAKGGRPILRLLLHAALGFAVLLMINLTTFVSGVHIPLNGWSAGATALFGAPGVCGQLLLQILFS